MVCRSTAGQFPVGRSTLPRRVHPLHHQAPVLLARSPRCLRQEHRHQPLAPSPRDAGLREIARLTCRATYVGNLRPAADAGRVFEALRRADELGRRVARPGAWRRQEIERGLQRAARASRSGTMGLLWGALDVTPPFLYLLEAPRAEARL